MSFLDDRQKRTGWLLIAVAALYLVWFLKARLLTQGVPIARNEWLSFYGMGICLVLGFANLRMAAAREEKRKLDQSNNTSA